MSCGPSPIYTGNPLNKMSIIVLGQNFHINATFEDIVEGINKSSEPGTFTLEDIEKSYDRALRLYYDKMEPREKEEAVERQMKHLPHNPRVQIVDDDNIYDVSDKEGSEGSVMTVIAPKPDEDGWLDDSIETASKDVFKGVDRILITKKGEIRSLGVSSDEMTKKSTEVWFVRERNVDGFGSMKGWMFIIPQTVNKKKRQILLPLTHLYNAKAKWEGNLQKGVAVKIDDQSLSNIEGVGSLIDVKNTFARMVSDKKDFGYWDALSPFAPSPIAARNFFYDFWTVKDKPPIMDAKHTTDITELLSRLDSMGLALARWEESEPTALDMRTLFKWLFYVAEFLTELGRERLSDLILKVWVRWKNKGNVSHLPGVLREHAWPLGKDGSPSQRLDTWVAGIRKGQQGLQNPKCFTEQGMIKRIKARLQKKNLKVLEGTKGSIETPTVKEALTFEKLRVPEEEELKTPVLGKVSEVVEETIGTVKSSLVGTYHKVRKLLTFRRAVVSGFLTKTYSFFCLPWKNEIRKELKEDPDNTWYSRVLSYPSIWWTTQKKRVQGIKYALDSDMGWRKFFQKKGILIASLILSPLTGLLEWISIPWF